MGITIRNLKILKYETTDTLSIKFFVVVKTLTWDLKYMYLFFIKRQICEIYFFLPVCVFFFNKPLVVYVL